MQKSTELRIVQISAPFIADMVQYKSDRRVFRETNK